MAARTAWLVTLIAIVGSLVSCDTQPEHPVNVDGPNAGSEECRNLNHSWEAMIERQADEDTRAEGRDTAEVNRVMRSQMTDEQQQTALRDLSAKQDIAKTARENRQSHENARLQQQLRAAGCKKQPN